MCWSATASVAMVALGGAAVAVTAMRGEPKAIWITLGFFTVMEGLQAVGYAVVDECSNPANQSITLLSYLHIAFQPLFINAFAMAIAPSPVPKWQARRVYGLASLATGFMLLKLVPLQALGNCTPGSPLCRSTVSWKVSARPLVSTSGSQPIFLLFLPCLFGTAHGALRYFIC